MNKIKCKILENIKGVDDGHIYPKDFKKDEIVSIGPALVKAFSSLNVISIIEEERIVKKIIEPKYEKKIVQFKGEKKNKKGNKS